MTARDLRWRAGGLVLLAAAGAAGVWADSHPAWGLPAFALAVAGAILLIQGRHVPLAFRVERGRHRHLPSILKARHRQRTRDQV